MHSFLQTQQTRLIKSAIVSWMRSKDAYYQDNKQDPASVGPEMSLEAGIKEEASNDTANDLA